MYWFVHCKFFQEGSEAEQEHLLQRISVLYVQLLNIKRIDALEGRRPFQPQIQILAQP